MKRLVLLSVVALMLASAVFAPVAVAQVPGEVNIQSVTLGTGGSVTVAGTIECIQGREYQVIVEVRQRQGNQPYNFGDGFTSFDTCESTGPIPFSIDVFGESPFKKGVVLVNADGSVCDEFFNCGYIHSGIQEFRLR
jgi:hypothetical protein